LNLAGDLFVEVGRVMDLVAIEWLLYPILNVRQPQKIIAHGMALYILGHQRVAVDDVTQSRGPVVSLE
jgi:hypothetical protein